MKILLCCPYPLAEARGNSVAASRLAAGFRRAGHAVAVLAPPEVDDPAAVRSLAGRFRPDVVLVMHAWRCARAFEALGGEGFLAGRETDDPCDRPRRAGGEADRTPAGPFAARETGVSRGHPSRPGYPSELVPVGRPPTRRETDRARGHPGGLGEPADLLAAGAPPRVVSLRGTDLNEMFDRPDTAAVVRAVLDASAAIAVFHAEAHQRLVRAGPGWAGKARLIANGVSLGCSEVDFRGRLGIPRGAFVFGAVAGLREVKRPLLVLPWLERLRGSEPRVAWMHAGGPQEPAMAEELRAFARGRPWVFHLDHVPPAEIDSFLRAADVFVAASRSEGMPHAVREAMLAGLPLLLSDIDGHRAMAVPEREALFFTDEAGFLGQARRLLTDAGECRRLGSAARARVEADLARDDEIGSYLALFSEVLGRAC
ncbi:MAG: glycosyltransferase family 4 protein [Candidatus Riflebacteria bacterium]|nr:glycosyltransferase family 4 protein [Candidatus Riflebacteria bacterium]